MKELMLLFSTLIFSMQFYTAVAFVTPQRRLTFLPNKKCRYSYPKLHTLKEGNDKSDYRSNHPKASRHTQPKITTIQGLESFLEYLSESDDRIVIIEYYAAWCKSCHKFGMKYKQLARQYGDLINEEGEIVKEGRVRFSQVEYGANVRLCKTFGIKKLPFVQIYKAPLGKITDFVCGPKYFEERLTSRLEKYLSMTDEEIKFKRDMEDGATILGDEILTEVKDLSKKDSNSTSIDVM